MLLSRRSFLSGVLTVSACAAVPNLKALAMAPKIIGDGDHDDAPGINALIAGDPVTIVDDCISRKGGRLDFSGGTFLMREPLNITSPGVTIEHGTFIMDMDIDADHVVFVGPNGGDSKILRNYFELRRPARQLFTIDPAHLKPDGIMRHAIWGWAQESGIGND